MKIQAQKGTKDILPNQIETWRYIEKTANEVFSASNYKEIRTPIFESTNLFIRAVGDFSDIVNKEMYTFEKNSRSITLRPENTASVVRAYIENGMHRLPSPVKLWYFGPMFRYERPQAGRQRQFHQIGVEFLGVEDPSCDAEVILTSVEFLNKLLLNDLSVEINSLGCDNCQESIKTNLKSALKQELDNLCEDCKIRYDKNILRVLDCKNVNCIKILDKETIKSVFENDYICYDCKKHFEEVKKYLDTLGIKYIVNKKLVRGLDYYNRTVFEIKSEKLGSQNAICGGGRYDSLVESLNGPKTPAFGFAIGVERLVSLIEPRIMEKLDYFVVSNYIDEALKLVKNLREFGFSCDFDYSNKKFTKQMEKASKVAKFALILGDDELKNNYISVKNMDTGLQIKIRTEELCQTLNNFNGLC